MAMSSVDQSIKKTETTYEVNWGKCPIKTSTDLAVILTKEYDMTHSLLKVQEKIVTEHLQESYYLSYYAIGYSFIKPTLRFIFDCPEVLMNIELLKEGKKETAGLLVSNGKIFDPGYEVVLRREGMLQKRLPYLTMTRKDFNDGKYANLVKLMEQMPTNLKSKISEFILGDYNELSLSLNMDGTSSFLSLGPEYWDEKIGKADQIYRYFSEKKRIPKQVSLASDHKVIVKF
jgi:hypothetical protein